jgi:thiamine biosynthesis lipoprotein
MTTRDAPRRLGRRRAMLLIAAAGGLSLAGPPGRRGRSAPPLHEWRGAALGAESRLVLVHPEPRLARRMLVRCTDEVRRLERIFSLYDPDSELCRFNRAGRLAASSQELRFLLAEALRFGDLSGGAFDVTVQPLWQLYAEHFAARPGDPDGPDPRALEAARRLVNYRAIDLGGEVGYRQAGMAVTLNGIAQGYITDRVADLLRDAGFERVLVQLGETFAGLPPEPGAPPWRIGVPDPAEPRALLATIELSALALATSSGLGTQFDAQGRHHHLFDPATGRSASRYRSVTVIAARATVADALSTALAILPPERAATCLHAAGAECALLAHHDGRVRWLEA